MENKEYTDIDSIMKDYFVDVFPESSNINNEDVLLYTLNELDSEIKKILDEKK